MLMSLPNISIPVSNQFSTLKQLKEKLSYDHIGIHMCFAENYHCRSYNEVKTAYFSISLATLHLVLI